MVSSENVLAAIVPHLVGGQNTLDDTTHDCSDPRDSQQEEDNQGGHQLNVRNSDNDPHSLRSIVGSVVYFDPHSVAAEDEFTFEAHSSINEYLEEHMRHTLDKKTRGPMHRDHPIPNTPAMKPPQVDKFIKDHLASRFPAREDGDLSRVQSALLRACGPITCMWSELIEHGLLEDPDASINVIDVLHIMQRTLVLLGNANELLSQVRRTNLLQLVNTALAKYGQETQPQAGEFLFGSGFPTKLKSQVEADTSLTRIVASLPSQRHPYSHTRGSSSTISRTKQQFFRGSPAGGRGTRRGGPHSSPYHSQPRGRGAFQFKRHYQSAAPRSRRS